MTPRSSRALAWSLFGVTLLLAATGNLFLFLRGGPLLENTIFGLIFMAMGAVGALIAARRSDNAIGWVLVGAAFTIALSFAGSEYATYAAEEGSLPGAAWAGWVGNWGWAVGIAPMVTFLFLLFPDGRLPSRRWRPVARLAGFLLVLLWVLGMVDPGMEIPGADNPIGVESARDAIGMAIGVAFLVLAVVALLSAASLVVRFRGARGDERQQIKWLAFAGVLLSVELMLSTIGEWIQAPLLLDSFFMSALTALAFLSIPVAVGIALLRYRLYEIDVVIRKTLVVAVVAVFITLVYVGIVVGIGAVVASASDGPLSIVAAVVIAVAFQPVRSAANRLSNRLVLGERATPYEVLSAFSERLAGAYATEDLLPRMARILGEGTAAQRADVWLRVGTTLRLAAQWPFGVSGDGPRLVGLTNGELPPLDGDRALPVRHEGELLGAIAVTKPPSEPLSHEEGQLLEHLAAQAGLVLKNARLTEELRARLDELQASRQRIVAAQDEERRRLERNLHDGAQQQLVALAVKQRLVESLVTRDPDKAAALLGELQGDTASALDNLRDLARGIYPPLLADKGLAAALQAQGGKAAVPTTVRAEGIQRYSQEAEAAVYFCSLEALQNVAKYADASRVTIILREEDDAVAFTIQDDGIGFDPATIPRGAGMQNMADRLSALGGTFEVRSAQGSGTTVVGRVPVEPASNRVEGAGRPT